MVTAFAILAMFFFSCLSKYLRTMHAYLILAVGGPYWVPVSQKDGSLLGPYLEAWGSLLVLETVEYIGRPQQNYGSGPWLCTKAGSLCRVFCKKWRVRCEKYCTQGGVQFMCKQGCMIIRCMQDVARQTLKAGHNAQGTIHCGLHFPSETIPQHQQTSFET